MQCSYFINGDKRCKLKTNNSNGFCHRHKHVEVFKFAKPETCPVCYNSIHQCVRPLVCGHWIHRRCVQKSGKPECPLCRKPLPDIPCTCTRTSDTEIDNLLNDPNFARVDIPEDAIIFAVIVYQLYAFVVSPNNRVLGLNHFISCILNDIIPIEHPGHQGLATFMYGEALQIFFNPEYWARL